MNRNESIALSVGAAEAVGRCAMMPSFGVNRRMGLVLAFVGVLCLLPAKPAAALHPYIPFAELVHSSDAVFEGTVTGSSARWNANRNMILTDVTIEQINVINKKATARGDFATRVVLTFAGGELDGVGVNVSGIPQLVVGERYVLFALMDGKTYASPVLGGTQGLFRVMTDAQTGERYPVAFGDRGIESVSGDRLSLTDRVEAISNGVVQLAPASVMEAAPIASSREAGAVKSLQAVRPERILTIEQFKAEIAKVLSAPAPLTRAFRGLKDSPPSEPSQMLTPSFLQQHGTAKSTEPRTELVPGTPVFPAPVEGEAKNIFALPSRPESMRTIEALFGERTPAPRTAGEIGDVARDVAGTALCYCGYFDLNLVMEQVPGGWWSWSHNNDSMWQWNQFMDIYRYVASDGLVGNNNDNEFAGWPSNADLNNIWGFNWGGFLALAITWFPSGCPCCEMSQADLMFNPAYSWFQNFSDTLGVSGRILYRPVVMHELGHTWGFQRGSCTEDYSYNRVSVMHAYYWDLVEDGWGIHNWDAFAIRDLYDDQKGIPTRVDMGVESYYASSGLINSTTNASTYFVGDLMTVRNLTVENMSSSSTANVRIRLYLSTNNTISTGDHQTGNSGNDSWGWGTFNNHSWSTANYTTRIPDVSAGTYYVGAIVSTGGFSYSGDDLNFNNKTFLYSTITVKRRPGNDDCADAKVIGIPSFTTGTTIDATTDIAGTCFGTTNNTAGVWYRVAGTGHTMSATTCNSSTNFDTKITVYCNDCAVRSCVASNDDSAGVTCSLNGQNRKSRLSWCSQVGTDYLILVHGYGGSTGNFRLDVGSNSTPCADPVSCGGVSLGACCAPQTCNAANAGTCDSGTPYCNANFDCFCFKTAEGGSACMQSHACFDLVACPNGTSDCPGEEVCTVDTCCNGPVCAPIDCPTADGVAALNDFSDPVWQSLMEDDGINMPPMQADISAIQARLDAEASVAGVEGCFETTFAACFLQGLRYQGDGTACNTVECNPPGACCFEDGTCSDLTPGACVSAGGNPQGAGTDCGTFTCPQPTGACCAPEECTGETAACNAGFIPTCNAAFGCGCVLTAEGETKCLNVLFTCGVGCPNGSSDCPVGSVCVVDTCCGETQGRTCVIDAPCPGSPDGVASSVEGAGTLFGDSSLGAVAGEVLDCIDWNEETCAFWSGDYQGDLTTCLDTVCHPTDEACCQRDGTCSMVLPEECAAAGGSSQGAGSICITGLCPAIVACCLPDGRCGDMTLGGCLERLGTPLPDGVLCQGDRDGDGVDDACGTEPPCEDCGPGAHWVDECRAGDDAMPTGALIGIDTNFDCVADLTVRLNGPVRIRRTDPMDDSRFFRGLRPIDGHNDVIDTEMVALNLTGGGMSMVAGAGQGQGGVLNKSLGAIAESTGDKSTADSFFEVFVEIEVEPGKFLYNHDLLRVDSVIDCLPPETNYIHPRGLCIPLYDTPIIGLGLPVANIVAADHRTYPCGDELAGTCFEPNSTPYCDQADCCETICQEVPSCCEEKWHDLCASLAKDICDPLGACCMFDYTCQDMTVLDCQLAQGEWLGEGTDCATTECRPLFACCLPDGSCGEMPTDVCLERGGTPLAPSLSCLGDQDGDGTDDVCQEDMPCDVSGPGTHWVDRTPAGDDLMPSSALIGIDFEGDCIADQSVRLTGPVRVRRMTPSDISNQFPGVGVDDGHADVVDTEILSMNLTGGGIVLTAGGGLGMGGMLSRSMGAIVEVPRDSTVADSFFDVFFEVELSSGQRAYNHEPLRVESRINCLPPDTTYIHPQGCIKLFDSPIVNQGNVVAFLVTADHSTFPACGDADTGSCLEPNGSPFCDDGSCCKRVCELLPECCEVDWNAACAGAAQEICVQPEACCLETGDCSMQLSIDCQRQGGEPQGAGTTCDTAQCRQPEACCLPDGLCSQLLPERCRIAGGTRLGPGTTCEGDRNGNNQDDACEPDSECEDCGRGVHWIDQCPGGSDNMPTGALVGIDFDGDCAADVSLVLRGPASVWRSDSMDDSLRMPGLSAVDGHRDVIDTEMVALQLSNSSSGVSMIAGAGMGQGGLLKPTFGAIVEQAGDTSVGDSFFDVFFEVDIGGGRFVYNQIPIRVKSAVDCLPPNANYLHPRGCTPLFDSPFAGTGNVLANLVSADHSTYPRCGDPVAGDCYSANGTPFCDDEACCKRVCDARPHCCEGGWDDACVNAAEVFCVPDEACCLPTGQCIETQPFLCQERGGVPQGPQSSCVGFACPRPQEACCFPTGGCDDMDPVGCLQNGGISLGPNTVCDPTTCSLDESCADCAQGDHWIDQCPGGADNMSTGAKVGIDLDFDCLADVSVVLSGPVSVWRSGGMDDSVQFPGTSPADGHLDVIDTEMVSMSLTHSSGVSLTAGQGMGNGGVLPPTYGVIVERLGSPALGDSFFDVFFEVDDGSGQLSYNHRALRVKSEVNCLPPNATYIHPRDCIPLFDGPPGTTAVQVGNLVSADHSTDPDCGDPVTGSCFEANDTPYCDEAECCFEICAAFPDCCTIGWNAVCAQEARQLCPRPTVPCCLPDGDCVDTDLATCEKLGGTPSTAGPFCDGITCPRPTEACCLADDICINATLAECLSQQGSPRGPGTACHTVTCPGFIESDHFADSNGVVELIKPDGSIEIIGVHGTTWVDVFFESNEGDANDDDGNGRDEVRTHMKGLDLRGHSSMGPVQVGVSTTIPSVGMIEERVQNVVGLLDIPPFAAAGSANSFFDVFFEIQVGSMRFQTLDPKRMSTVITHKPPAGGDQYEGLDTIPLYDMSGALTGYRLGSTRHQPNPVIEHDYFADSSGVVELIGPLGVETIMVHGPTWVDVYFEGANEGDANDDDGNGRDEVQTRMVGLDLNGMSSMGPVHVGLSTTIPSMGMIEERTPTVVGRLDLPPFAPSGLADSFFDMFFEIQIGAMRFQTLNPKRLSTVISHKPPANADQYEGRDTIPLYDMDGGLTAYSLGSTRHRPNPVIEHDHFEDSTGVVELIKPDGTTEVIQVRGQTDVDVYFEGTNEGDANDDDGNGKDEVTMRMVNLDLNGTSSMGPVHVGVSTSIPSMGLIEERTQAVPGLLDMPPFAAAGTADSFFDLYFEIQVGPLQFQTLDPKRLRAVITHKPPAGPDEYEGLDTIPLYDMAGALTGYALGSTRHRPNPPVPCCLPDGVCRMLDLRACRANDGVPQTLPDCSNVVCPLPPEACCLPDGSCTEMDPNRCLERSGIALGPQTVCLGDSDGNQIDDACQLDPGCDDCGPGEHWVEACPAGADNMPTGALVGIDRDGDCIPDLSLRLTGPVSVWRSNAMDDSLRFPGLRPTDGHRDVIDTEMVSMSLTRAGVTMTAGAGLGQGGVLPGTFGAIAEDPGDPLVADSFFDVFFEVELGAAQFVYNWSPLRVESRIDCLPPDADYIHPIDCIPLYDTPFPSPGGVWVANLVTADHTTYPTCGDPVTGDCHDPENGSPFCDDLECCELVCTELPHCCDDVWDARCAELASACPTGCPPARIVESQPPHRVVDARQPSLPDNALPRMGIGSPGAPGIPSAFREPIILLLDPPIQGLGIECFNLCETEIDRLTGQNFIRSVVDLGNGKYEIVLQRAITPGAVTTIQYKGGGSFVEFTSHPANVNGDSRSAANDILEIIDILNGAAQPVWGHYSTDVDRSGATGAADILRVIDLLNGAQVYFEWNGTRIPDNTTCP